MSCTVEDTRVFICVNTLINCEINLQVKVFTEKFSALAALEFVCWDVKCYYKYVFSSSFNQFYEQSLSVMFAQTFVFSNVEWFRTNFVFVPMHLRKVK